MQVGRYTIEFIQGHVLVRANGGTLLIDTGSPMTMRAPAIVSEKLGVPVSKLVGTDTLRAHPFILDYRAPELVILDAIPNVDAMRWIPLVERLGVFQTSIRFDGRSYNAIIDTGAWLSYAPPAVVEGLQPRIQLVDFHPAIGEFTADVHDLTLMHNGRDVTLQAGVLPPLYALALSLLGPATWILGWEFLKDRAWIFDFANSRFADVSSAAAVHKRHTMRDDRRSSARREVDRASTHAVVAPVDWLERFITEAANSECCFDYRCGTCGATQFRSNLAKAVSQSPTPTSRVADFPDDTLRLAEGLRHVRQVTSEPKRHYIVRMLILLIERQAGELKTAESLPQILGDSWAGQVLCEMQEHYARELERQAIHERLNSPEYLLELRERRRQRALQRQSEASTRKAEIDRRWWASHEMSPAVIEKRATRAARLLAIFAAMRKRTV